MLYSNWEKNMTNLPINSHAKEATKIKTISDMATKAEATQYAMDNNIKSMRA